MLAILNAVAALDSNAVQTAPGKPVWLDWSDWQLGSAKSGKLLEDSHLLWVFLLRQTLCRAVTPVTL